MVLRGFLVVLLLFSMILMSGSATPVSDAMLLNAYASIYMPWGIGIVPQPCVPGVPAKIIGFSNNGPSLLDIPNFMTSSITVDPGGDPNIPCDYNIQATVSWRSAHNGWPQSSEGEWAVYVNGVQRPGLVVISNAIPSNSTDLWVCSITGLCTLYPMDVVELYFTQRFPITPVTNWTVEYGAVHLSILRLMP